MKKFLVLTLLLSLSGCSLFSKGEGESEQTQVEDATQEVQGEVSLPEPPSILKSDEEASSQVNDSADAEPAQESKGKPATDPADAEPAAEPADAEPADAEPAQGSEDEPAAEPADVEPVQEPEDEPAAEPADVEPAQEPEDEPAAEPADVEPVQEPEDEPAAEPADVEPAQEPEDEPTEQALAPVSFNLNATNFAYSQNSLTVKEGQEVTINLNITEGFHDFKIDGVVQTQASGEGSSQVAKFTAPKKGTYEFYCSVGSHRGMGMVGTLIVE